MAFDPITTNEALINILKRECSKFSDKYFPLHAKQVRSLEAATALVHTNKSSIRKNPGKSRAVTILTDLWTHAQEVYVLCALATSQTSLGALKTLDYIKSVQTWWAEHPTKPRGLIEILHFHSNSLPTTRGISNFVTATTTVAQLAKLMLKVHGDTPLVITCPFSGMPLPFIQIGQGAGMKVELSMRTFSELMQVTDEGL